jgi:hypothetical protein
MGLTSFTSGEICPLQSIGKMHCSHRKKKIPLAEMKYDWRARLYQNTLLIFGIAAICLGLYQLPTIFTPRSNLAQIKGKLRAGDTYITTVTDARGNESRKAELIFYLYGRQQKYYLAENIGNEWRDRKYEDILKALNRADTVTLWIRKSEVERYEPKVFQIDDEKETLLDFNTVRETGATLNAFMFLLGVGSILMFLWIRFPRKFKQMFGINKQRN